MSNATLGMRAILQTTGFKSYEELFLYYWNNSLTVQQLHDELTSNFNTNCPDLTLDDLEKMIANGKELYNVQAALAKK